MDGEDRRSGGSWEYFDFDVTIGEDSESREYPISIRSPAGEAQDIMNFPFDELELVARLREVEEALLASSNSRRRLRTPEEQTIQEFGKALFQALMVDDVRVRYEVSLGDARLQWKGLRIKLHIQPSELMVLPWEFLYDPSRDFLCLMTNTPLTRYLDLPQPMEPLHVDPPLKVLGMVASPQGLPRLNVGHEKRLVEDATKGLQADGLLELTWLQGQTWRDLRRAMRQGPWHIFHFIGHSGFDTTLGEGAVAFANDRGYEHTLGATDLSRLLNVHQPLRLVFLNSCEGTKGSPRDAYSSIASTLVRSGIPAVLAMQYEITNSAAIECSRAFYEAVAEGLPVDAAVTDARMAVSFGSTLEWAIPVLHMRSTDGHIFDIPTGGEPSGRSESVEEVERQAPAHPEQQVNAERSRTPEARAIMFLNDGYERFQRETASRDVRLPLHGSWEVSVVFDGGVSQSRETDEELLTLLNESNPRYTGWPVWVDSRGFVDATSHPYVYQGGWEAYIFGKSGGIYNHLDFWRVQPVNAFYLYRALQDDLSEGGRSPEPMTVLDPLLAILRTAEAIAVPIAFARALGLDPEETTLHFVFRWSGLRNRELSAWANPERHVSPGYICRQPEVTSGIAVPLETPLTALGSYVRAATIELLTSFRGYSLGLDIVQDLTARLLERRL